MTSIRYALVAAFALALAPCGLAAGDDGAFTPELDWDRSEPVEIVSDLDARAAEQWQTYVDATYLVPRGVSYSPVFDFGWAGVRVSALRAELFEQRGDVCNAGLYAVDVATTPNQILATRLYANNLGVVQLPPQTPIFKAVVVLQQNAVLASRCGLRFSGLVGTGGNPDQPDTGDFQMLGALAYGGGLANVEVNAGGAKVTRFYAKVPAFCAGVEVLEGGTVTEGQYDKARLVDAQKLIFEVNGGAGARVGSIRLVLNGPRTSVCDVPVYVK